MTRAPKEGGNRGEAYEALKGSRCLRVYYASFFIIIKPKNKPNFIRVTNVFTKSFTPNSNHMLSCKF